jgi:hypothetical protein
VCGTLSFSIEENTTSFIKEDAFRRDEGNQIRSSKLREIRR